MNPNFDEHPDSQSGARTSPLKVQFVITSLPVGGAEVLLLNLVERMDRTRFTPEVICLKEAGELAGTMQRFADVQANLLANRWDLRVLPRLIRLLRGREADAVITVGAGDKMFWGRLAAKLAGVPVICSALHSTGWPDGVGKLNRWLTPITDAFIAVAAHHAEFLVEFERFPSAKVCRIPNGVDVERFRPDPAQARHLRQQLGLDESTPLVGIVAALREEKNHLQFVEAAGEVLNKQPQTHFVVVGDGPCRSEIEGKVFELGLTNHFHLLGSRSDVAQLLPALDVFCLTSRNEANPVSILEALACGVPVVAPDVGSIKETVLPYRTGFLTRPLSAQSTAESVMRILSDRSLATAMRTTGRELVVKQWSLERMVEGYERLIGGLYNQKAVRSDRPLWIGPPIPEATECPTGTAPALHLPELNEGRGAISPVSFIAPQPQSTPQ